MDSDLYLIAKGRTSYSSFIKVLFIRTANVKLWHQHLRNQLQQHQFLQLRKLHKTPDSSGVLICKKLDLLYNIVCQYMNNRKVEALELRKQNYSLADIAGKLSISKSTASIWLKDYPLSKEILVLKKRKNGQRLGNFQRENRKKRCETALSEAKKEIGSITKRDLFMLGIALYIGEGTKWQNLVRIVNSDPKVVKLVVRWLQEICGVNKDNVFLRIHGYPDTDFTEAKKYWARVAGVDPAHFQSYVVDKRVNKSKKRGLLPYGTVHVNVVGDRRGEVNLGLKIRKWMEVVLD